MANSGTALPARPQQLKLCLNADVDNIDLVRLFQFRIGTSKNDPVSMLFHILKKMLRCLSYLWCIEQD